MDGLNIRAAAPPGGPQRWTQARIPGLVVLVEVQPEAEELQTLIRAGHQQPQELLNDALWEERHRLKKDEREKVILISLY